ncbi:DUF6647 family protein [Neogemmobacter tilapiae]|uniref:DUF6647 domain-containing protein n=1 Tax=Neogemmobacter tilapiae TaxID=875041 RepID=A0A918WFA8_9RHOB|nr:DUF6647 family protein [Gemmobacter tilapiae]GHC43262.1 hypothetical protein GCM10007315_00280 [Gemmobacter tilapiae]
MIRRALALLILPALPAFSTPQDTTLCALASKLAAWMAQNSSLPALAACPPIQIGTLPEGDALRAQAGAYDPATGVITLAADLDLGSAYGQSYLLHELAHAAQHQSGLPMHCHGRLEAQAYALQADFLTAKGLARDAAILRVMGQQLGQCPGESSY